MSEQIRSAVATILQEELAVARRLDDAFVKRVSIRAANQLVGSGLSAEEIRGLLLIRRHLIEGGHDWREGTAMADVAAGHAALDRITFPPAVDYLAGIHTILASNMPGEAMRKALEELAGLR